MYTICDGGGSSCGKVTINGDKVEVRMRTLNLKNTTGADFWWSEKNQVLPDKVYTLEASDKLDAIRTVMADLWDESFTPEQRFAEIQRILAK